MTCTTTFILLGALVQGAKSLAFPVSTDTSAKFIGYTDVAPTSEGWLPIWGANRSTNTRWVRVHRLSPSGSELAPEQELVRTSSWKWEHPAGDCDGNDCMVSWKQTAHITSRVGQILSSGMTLGNPIEAFGFDSSTTRRPSVSCVSSNCTVGATRDRGSGRFAEAQLIAAGRKSGGETKISTSQLGASSEVQVKKVSGGQVWLYSTKQNNVVTARVRQMPSGNLGAEFAISGSADAPRHWPQLACLPTGLCAAGWPEGTPRWRLFRTNRVMVTGVLSDVTDPVPTSESVGVALTNELMLRLWQTFNGSTFQLLGQWVDFQGVSVGGVLPIAVDDTPMRFGARGNQDQVFVIWGDNRVKKPMGEIFVAPKITSSTSTRRPTTTSTSTRMPTTTTSTTTSTSTRMPTTPFRSTRMPTTPSPATTSTSTRMPIVQPPVTSSPKTSTSAVGRSTVTAPRITTLAASVLTSAPISSDSQLSLSSSPTTAAKVLTPSSSSPTTTNTPASGSSAMPASTSVTSVPATRSSTEASSSLTRSVSLVRSVAAPSPSKSESGSSWVSFVAGIIVGIACIIMAGMAGLCYSRRRKEEQQPNTVGLAPMNLPSELTSAREEHHYGSLALTPPPLEGTESEASSVPLPLERTDSEASAPPMSDPANYGVAPPPLEHSDTNYTAAPSPGGGQRYGPGPAPRYDRVEDEL